MRKAKILIDRFDLACRNMESLGARRKEEHQEIITEYDKSKADLERFIASLQSLLL